MNTHWIRFLGVVAMFVTSLSYAELQVIPKDYQYCTVCHGTMLQGNKSNAAPAIAALPAWFVEQELKAFKKDWRGASIQDFEGTEMHAVAKALTNKQIVEIAEFIGQLPAPEPAVSIHGDSDQGASLFGRCSACHGSDAKGNPAMGAPPLLVQSDWYLKSQLEKFHNGVRGTAAADQKGQMMAASAQAIGSEQDIDNLVSYINTLKTGE